jgi:hypothetical protein
MIEGGLAALAGAADLLDRVTLFGQPPSFVLHSSGHRALLFSVGQANRTDNIRESSCT